MMNYDLQYRIKLLKKEISQLRSEVVELKNSSNDELWDNCDMKKNWKVSQRTLATWRAQALIGYVQIGNKIWYRKADREAFLEKYAVKTQRK